MKNLSIDGLRLLHDADGIYWLSFNNGVALVNLGAVGGPLVNKQIYEWCAQQKEKIQMKFRPLNDRILVRPSKPIEQASLGLARPETQREKVTQGELLAVGPEALKAVNFDGVALVHWNEYAGRTIELDGEELLLLRLDEINGVFEEDE